MAQPQTSGLRTAQIVQFDTDVTPAIQASVRRCGPEVLGYWPDRALLLRANSTQARCVAQLQNVRSLVAQPHLWRLDPRLITAEGNGFGLVRLAVPHDVLVSAATAQDLSAVVAAAEAEGGEVVEAPSPAARTVHLILPAAALQTLSLHAAVQYIEPFVPLIAHNDQSYGILQSGSAHRSPLWDAGLHGEGQIIGVCDVGVATESCFFPPGKIVGYEHLTSSLQHDKQHGTHTAGILAGDNGNNGVYDYDDGMAPAAHLYVQDGGADATGTLQLPGDLAGLFTTAYAAGVRIHSDSWGTSHADAVASYGARERAVDAFVSQYPDFLVVLAAGNNSVTGTEDVVDSPAAAKNVITVGALDGRTPDKVAAFSSHGPTADGRIKPTLMAPGVAVASASVEACSTTVLSGTSQAAPTLAGGAALVRQYMMAGYYPTGVAVPSNAMTPSAALLKAMLIAGADPMVGAGSGGALLQSQEGFGRVHLQTAAPLASDSRHLWLADDRTGLQQAEESTVQIKLLEPGSLVVALTWTDPPGALGAAAALVNDLDLKVTGPTGAFNGNDLKASESTVSAPAGDGDHLNVEEEVRLGRAPAGSYRITVRARRVPMGPQAFALVANAPAYTVESPMTVNATTEAGGANGVASAGVENTPGTAAPGSQASAPREKGSGCNSTAATGDVLIPAILLACARKWRKTIVDAHKL